MSRLAIDLDGVCYDWQRTYCYMLRTYFDLDIPPYETWWKEWDSQKQWGEKWMHDWMWKEGVERGLFRYGHMVKDARVVLERLASAGHDFVVVTHRPESAVQDTNDWLSLYFNGLPLKGIHLLTNGEPKSSVKADILVDDKLENIYEWPRRGLLFDQPWNWKVKTACWDSRQMRRVWGWEGVLDDVRN